jgi:hypothetical protein
MYRRLDSLERELREVRQELRLRKPEPSTDSTAEALPTVITPREICSETLENIELSPEAILVLIEE